jgi:Ca-activated chloride channel family protein
MTLEHPAFIAIALLAAGIVACAYYFALRRRTSQTLRYSNVAFLVAAVNARTWPAKLLGAVLVVAAALIVFAFAGPRVRAPVPVAGAVVLCIDTSGSMTASDVEPTRADAAVAALKDFVNAAPSGTAVGIVSFATGAQVILPPTRDRDQIRAAVDNIPAPNGATAIGDALIAAQRTLPKSGHRAVVLITDGENTYGEDPMAAARQLASSHIPLYTIGIGTNSGALIPGTLQTAGINEDALRAYAAATGGAYSRADNAVQLRGALKRLGRITTFERRTVDVSLPIAEAGAVLMVLAFLGGLAVGRYP